MKHKALKAQRGLGILALLFWIALVGSVLVVAMRTLPIVNEYMSIQKAVVSSAREGDAAAIRRAFDKQSQVDYGTKFSSQLLDIKTSNGITTVEFEYQRTVPLAGPVSLLFDLKGKETAR